MNRAQIAALAAEIMQAVIEDGRVQGENPESLRVEVEFEARDRGRENSEEIADMAVLIAGWAPVADYLTPAEAAQATGTSESHWRNKAAAGKVPGAIKKGKQWLLPRSFVTGRKDHEMINMRRKYQAWYTAFWSGTPPAPEFTSKPSLEGTPRQIKAAVDEFRQQIGSGAMMGFKMQDPKTGDEFSFSELIDAIADADLEIEAKKSRRY